MPKEKLNKQIETNDRVQVVKLLMDQRSDYKNLKESMYPDELLKSQDEALAILGSVGVVRTIRREKTGTGNITVSLDGYNSCLWIFWRDELKKVGHEEPEEEPLVRLVHGVKGSAIMEPNGEHTWI